MVYSDILTRRMVNGRQYYSSGFLRVHASGSIASIEAAIAEYEGWRGELELMAELQACARNLREELELRAHEHALGLR